MTMEHLFLPIPYTFQGRPPSQHIVYDNQFPAWRPAPSASLAVSYTEIIDCVPHLREVCSKINATLLDENRHTDYLVVHARGSHEDVRNARSTILSNALKIEKAVVYLDPQYVFRDPAQMTLRADFVATLDALGGYCNVALIVTRVGSDLNLNIYGTFDSVRYARYKFRIFLDYLQGFSIHRYEVPLSLQPLICGPKRGYLLNIFQQTGINVYTPPLAMELLGREANVQQRPVDEVYLVGDPVQIEVAKHILNQIVSKTDSLTKDISVSFSIIDTLCCHFVSDVEEIMTKYATFVQIPHAGALNSIIRVMGTTRSSIEATISAVIDLATKHHEASFLAHHKSADAHPLLPSIDVPLEQMSNAAAGSGATILSDGSCRYQVSGLNTQVKSALSLLAKIDAISTLDHQIEISFGLANHLKEFLVGKKQGKILKIMNTVRLYMWMTPHDEYSFHVHASAQSVEEAQTSLTLIGDELPVSRWLYIDPCYHKQMIGAGGHCIQTLMRKYNVYMRFGSSGEKYPNALGIVHMDNTLVRCPQRNARNLDPALNELLETVRIRSTDMTSTFVTLTRNQRRILLSSSPNLILDIEQQTNTAIKLSLEESRGGEAVEIQGRGSSARDAAAKIKANLPIDYEFRTACNPNFSKAVGPGSKFAARVTAPLRIALNAEVQAFERVQMQGDNAIYSQVVVSVHDDSSRTFESISQVLTGYLRDHGLLIVDKGMLTTDLQINENSKFKNKNKVLSLPLEHRVMQMDETPVRQRAHNTPDLVFGANYGGKFLMR